MNRYISVRVPAIFWLIGINFYSMLALGYLRCTGILFLEVSFLKIKFAKKRKKSSLWWTKYVSCLLWMKSFFWTGFAFYKWLFLISFRSLLFQGMAQGCISGICSFANVVSPLAFSPLTGNWNFNLISYYAQKPTKINKVKLFFQLYFYLMMHLSISLDSVLCALDLLR